jgi:hypothetical protein
VRSLVIIAALASWSSFAHADGFTWTAPASCPTSDDVRAKIDARLDKQVELDALVTVTQDRKGFTATIDLRALTMANDVRTLTATTCAELADAVALIVARVARDAKPVQTVDDPPKVNPGDPSVPKVFTKIEPPREKIKPHHVWGGGGHLLGLSGIGGVPEVGVGGEVAGYVRREAIYVEVGISRWLPSRAYVYEGAPARVDIGLSVIALRAGWGTERLPIRGWATVETGIMDGMGVDLANPQVGSGRWTAAGAGFGVAWPMTPWARVIGSVEFVFPFQRVNFVLQDGIHVYRSWAVSSRASFGVEIGWK